MEVSPQLPVSNAQSLPVDAVLEEFVIDRVLGSGGFGITYLARDKALERWVVLKENLPVQFCLREAHSLTVKPRQQTGEDWENFRYSLESFEREAATLASLDHPGIVKVLRSFKAHGTAYFVMPFVEGTALDEVIRQRHEKGEKFTGAEVEDLLGKVLAALGYLHDRGIYHRDIKPGNILLTRGGAAVLIDFGAARQRLSERSLTVIESAGYTPFEQLQSRGKIGPWSDIYALGGTLHKMLTGETPAKANDRIFEDPCLPLVRSAELAGRYPARLLESIDRAMAPKAADRFQDTAAWLGYLKTVVEPPPLPAPVNTVGLGMGAPGTLSGKGKGTVGISRGRKFLYGAAGLMAVAAGLVVLLFLARAPLSEWMINRGSCFYHGHGMPQDAVEAAKWFRRAAELGDASGMTVLGFCYETGTGVNKDEAEAARWYRKAAELGDARGMTNLGVFYQNGTGVGKDEAEAAKWYRKAAELGDAWGMTKLGFCYQNGAGVGKDEAEAAKWYRKAAELGDQRGMTNLGFCYQNGAGVGKDEAEAAKWYRKAAELGDEMGMTNLGVCYQNGTGVGKDEAEAAKWYRKAAELGDAEAMNKLGWCYEKGKGVSGTDLGLAVNWYTEAAERGHAGAMAELGFFYYNGQGVAQNIKEALKWLQKAAQLGNAKGMMRLGSCYYDGRGVGKDDVEAIKWFRKSAELGDARGMAWLGFCYQSGLGAQADMAEALRWYRKAAYLGDEFGTEALRRLEAR